MKDLKIVRFIQSVGSNQMKILFVIISAIGIWMSFTLLTHSLLLGLTMLVLNVATLIYNCIQLQQHLEQK